MPVNWPRLQTLGIALLLVMIPVSFVLAWAVGPVITSITEAQNDAAEVRRLHILADEKPTYQAALLRTRTILSGQGMLDPNIAATLASAQLQSTMQGLVATLGQPVSSSEIAPPQMKQGLQILSVSLSFNLPPNRLAPFLASIDAQRPHLSVQTLDLRSTDNGGGNGLLNVQLQVSEFRDVQ